MMGVLSVVFCGHARCSWAAYLLSVVIMWLVIVFLGRMRCHCYCYCWKFCLYAPYYGKVQELRNTHNHKLHSYGSFSGMEEASMHDHMIQITWIHHPQFSTRLKTSLGADLFQFGRHVKLPCSLFNTWGESIWISLSSLSSFQFFLWYFWQREFSLWISNHDNDKK